MFPFDRRTDEEFVSIVDVIPDSRRFRYRSVPRMLTERLGYQMTGKCVDGSGLATLKWRPAVDGNRRAYNRRLEH